MITPQTSPQTSPQTRPDTQADRRVVVGLDGSPGSITALRWAVDQARLTGATVEAVGAWQTQPAYGLAFGESPVLLDGDDLVAVTQKAMDEAVAAVVGAQGHPGEVVTRVVQGHPAQVLMEAADGAQLLVVGSRGHGTFAGLLLGSVSQHCVQHTRCPVVVVPR